VRKPRRYTITGDDNRCTLTYSPDADRLWGHEDGPAERTYWAPDGGGYVRDTTHQPGTLGSQVCNEMASMGHTLHWGNIYWPLADLIRHEVRKAYASQARMEAAR